MESIAYSQNGAHVTITLNKPPANSYELSFLTALGNIIETINQDPTCKIVLINSDSEKFFCAGADIKVFGNNTVEQNKEMVVAARRVCHLINTSSKIFIAAFRGHILGGGLELAMACDIRLAAEGQYLIGLPEIKLGLIPGNGGTVRLINLIGASRAMELLVTGNTITATTAHQYGLINHLYPTATFEEEVNKYCSTLALGAGEAMASIKKFVLQSQGMSTAEALNLETALVNPLYETPDGIEGFQAFIEKRTPNFK
ncbi:enoyl-CoA hydratase/isomerase family protein [Flavobacterium saccharophilum]|uniref:Short chain enoyl-CoA hydratase n=1 Tax=Flavobacterium saccharophilum TaxID=29534 RepID=A0A1M7JIG7_9FLAO|nr:enoyl-CoA hydratase-related protein [Flavobacterium saccharophilum]SHM52889.1 short chain enoyl-CoA hydratase [Flavobacterium saccharophilum]